MEYISIDMASYNRKDHFNYFNSLAYPYVGLTAHVDITDCLQKIKSQKLPFFLTICYCVSRAANSVPEFRQRVRDGGIIEFQHCKTSHTVSLEDGTYCYCTLDDNMPFHEYLSAGERAQEAAKAQQSIKEDPEEVWDKFFISSLPWISYTSLIQPVPMPADSNPRITWGKYFPQEGRIVLPLSVLCHHALVDGLHIAAFYRALEQELAEVSA